MFHSSESMLFRESDYKAFAYLLVNFRNIRTTVGVVAIAIGNRTGSMISFTAMATAKLPADGLMWLAISVPN